MTVALTYYLKRQCGNIRPFCRKCTNTFKLNTCDTICTDGPTVICLKPVLPQLEPSNCCQHGPEDARPRFVKVTVTPTVWSCGVGEECCCADFQTEWVLMWDDVTDTWQADQDTTDNECYDLIRMEMNCFRVGGTLETLNLAIRVRKRNQLGTPIETFIYAGQYIVESEDGHCLTDPIGPITFTQYSGLGGGTQECRFGTPVAEFLTFE